MNPQTPPDPEIQNWPTKHEAAATIGVTLRSVERMIAEGDLRKATLPRARRKPVTVVDPAGVERILAARRPRPAVLTMRAPDIDNEVALMDDLSKKIAENVDRAYRIFNEPRIAPPPKTNVKLAEAVDISGLPRKILLTAIREGRLAAHQLGKTYFIHREDLAQFRPAPRKRRA